MAATWLLAGTWLSNFFPSFSNPLRPFTFKMESLRKREKVVRIGGKGERKNGSRVKK